MCRARRPALELARAGRDAAGEWYAGSGPGRGAWWCRSGACVERMSAEHLARALRRGVGTEEFARWRDLVGASRRPPGSVGVKE